MIIVTAKNLCCTQWFFDYADKGDMWLNPPKREMGNLKVLVVTFYCSSVPFIVRHRLTKGFCTVALC